jgi:hypothetical protein
MSNRGLIITGIVLSAFAVYLLAFLLPDFIRSAVGPQPMTMAEAAIAATASDSYVAITDGTWACETIQYVRGRSATSRYAETTRFTELFRTNESGTVLLLATMSGEVDCDGLQATSLVGYLQRMTPAREQELINEVRLARFINATGYLELCGYCGPTNSLIGTIFGFAFALLGIGLVFWGWHRPLPSVA